MKVLQLFGALIILGVVSGSDPRKVLRKLTKAIGNAVLECKEQVDFSDSIIYDFLLYWEPDYYPKEAEMGCVFFCVAKKLQLIEAEGNPVMNNAEGFEKANGADDEITKRLISVYQECRKIVGFSEPCSAMLRIALCFREKVTILQWAPKPSLHYEEDYDEEF